MANHVYSLEISPNSQNMSDCPLSGTLEGDTLFAELSTSRVPPVAKEDSYPCLMTSSERTQAHLGLAEKSPDELAKLSKDERRAYHQARRALSQHEYDNKTKEVKSKAERRALQEEQRKVKDEAQGVVFDKRTCVEALREQRRECTMLRNPTCRHLRVLALHGLGCCAEVFNSKRTKDLQRCLADILEMQCADGFHELQHLGEQRRGWFDFEQSMWEAANMDLGLLTRAVLDGPSSFNAVGLDDSLSKLRDVWFRGDYDGILGFSQGATMAAMLLASLQDASEPLPRFAICIAGFGSPCPNAIPFYPPKQPLKVPSLHVWGALDDCVKREQSQSLAKLFSDECATWYQHEGGHCVPQKAEDIDVIAKFLENLPLDHG